MGGWDLERGQEASETPEACNSKKVKNNLKILEVTDEGGFKA